MPIISLRDALTGQLVTLRRQIVVVKYGSSRTLLKPEIATTPIAEAQLALIKPGERLEKINGMTAREAMPLLREAKNEAKDLGLMDAHEVLAILVVWAKDRPDGMFQVR